MPEDPHFWSGLMKIKNNLLRMGKFKVLRSNPLDVAFRRSLVGNIYRLGTIYFLNL
jgi:hypothetical protein